MKRMFAFLAMMLLGFAPMAHAESQKLVDDWLFQCDNEPTLEKASQEIGYAREMAVRMKEADESVDVSAQLKRLLAIEKGIAAASEDQAKDLYLAVRQAKREIMLANPLLDFNEIVLIDNPYPKGKPGDVTDEWGHEARHRNGFMAVDGGRLLVLEDLHPDAPVRDLFDGHEGSFWRPDVSFDGKKVLVSFKPAGERSFHLYEVNADGTDVKQLTKGDYDDLDPVYTPDGHIMFCTSRSHTYVRCMPMTHAFAVARCDGDGKNIYVVSRNGEPEYNCSVMNDGRVLYTRWEYTDKALWRVQSLWTVNPDGTQVQTFWGNQSVWPDVLAEARAIPGSRKVMFTGLGHHAWFDGAIGVIDPDEGLNYPDGLTRVTRETPWPEVGNGPEDPEEKVPYHASGNHYAYKSPYPLSEELFLVSAREGARLYNGPHNDWFFSLYLMDVHGNKELIYKGEHNAYYAMPLKARPVPPQQADRVLWPKIGSGEKPASGVMYSNNVFEGAPEILKDNGKYIRVVQMDPKTYTTWHKTVQHDGPAVGVTQAEGVKRILGTVPIEEDGSICFELPSGQSVYFQMLDENQQCIHVMRSFTGVMPGETRGCFGCHESKQSAVSNPPMQQKISIAMSKGPAKLQEPSWGADTSISYERFVQPVLDKNCGECHQNPDHKAFAKLDMTFRPSTHRWRNRVSTRPDDVSPFAEPYLTMVSGKTPWGRSKERDDIGVPKNLAGIFVVEGYDKNDPANLETLAPYSAFSPKSLLIQKATSGKHNGVKVEGEELERLVAWVDCNGPYLGDEEIRAMNDPISDTVCTIPPIRPRVGTAPVINRFDLRQDGNSWAVAGVDLRINDVEALRKSPNSLVEVLGMAEIMNEKLDIEIVAANYGTKETRVDCVDKVKEYFNGTRYIPIGKFNDAFGDPIQGTPKMLRIAYKIDGGQVIHSAFNEGEKVILPKP